MAELESSSVFTNGITDLVVVCFDKPINGKATTTTFTHHDDMIGSLSESIKTASKGNYVAMYAANMPASSQLIWTFEEHSRAEQSQNLMMYMADGNDNSNCSNSSNCSCFSNCSSHHRVNYFPGPLIEVFIISAILLAMLFTGACAIFSLQTPDKWEAPKSTVKRDI